MIHRTIKFRIYDPEQNKMVYSGGTPTMLSGFFQQTAHLNTKLNQQYQQFTGFDDKEAEQIYEGDIVRYEGTELKEKECPQYTIFWSPLTGGFAFQSEDNILTFYENFAKLHRVIGLDLDVIKKSSDESPQTCSVTGCWNKAIDGLAYCPDHTQKDIL